MNDQQPADDPLRVSVPMPFDFVCYPYGVPVRFRTNWDLVAEAARETWSSWSKRFDVPCVEVRCLVDLESDPDVNYSAPPVIRAQGHLLTIAGASGNFACCDLSNAFAFGWITRAVAADRDYLRFYFLEAMVYSILSAKYLVIIHAACVASKGEAILLAGDSGAGKTSLAYACALSGWTFISDDASVLWGDESNRLVLGDSRRLRFRDSAAYLFPELSGRPASREPWRGKPTLEVLTDSINIRTAREAHPRQVVFLRRHADPSHPATLIELRDVTKAAARLYNNPWPEELGNFERNNRVIHSLLKVPAYELHYCRIDDAVSLLSRFLNAECA
jgi:hypothetical protein